MTRQIGRPPLLVEPITARFDRAGQLIRADTSLLRWQAQAGGRHDGPLALPQLAALVRASLAMDMRLAEAVEIADSEQDHILWAETAPDANGLDLSIIGRIARDRAPPAWRDGAPPALSVIDVQLDRTGRIIFASGGPAAAAVGQDFGAIFAAPAQEDGSDRITRCLAERQPLTSQPVRCLTDGSAWLISGGPLLDRAGEFGGTALHLNPAMPLASATDHPAADRALPERFFGQQLAPALRQPLHRIMANAETIGAQRAGPIRHHYASYARDIADAARHLIGLINDLGDLEAVDLPNFSVAADAIDLLDCARRAAGLLAVRAAARGVRVVCDDGALPAIGEQRRVLQILVNVIGNAIHYGPPDAAVTLAGGVTGGMARLTVADQGTGIAMADRERIFERFERLGRSGDGGSGLGLHIARRLARAMGGDLVLDDEQNGSEASNAAFTLILPSG